MADVATPTIDADLSDLDPQARALMGSEPSLPEQVTADAAEVSAVEISEDDQAVNPAEALLRIRDAVIEGYNTEVAETFKRLLTLADGLDELQRASLVRVDSTACPRNTVFEHIRQYFV